MIYVLILITYASYAANSTGYEFTSLENCQNAWAALEQMIKDKELDGWGREVHGVCVLK